MQYSRVNGKNHTRQQVYAALKKELAKRPLAEQEATIKLAREVKKIVSKKMNRKQRYYKGDFALKGNMYRRIGSRSLKEVGIC